MKNKDENYKTFWKDKENEKGGKLMFYTYARYIGRSNWESCDLGGLIYIIDKTLYFEDFEKDNWFSKIISQKKKYEKTEFSFTIEDIDKIKIITKSSALNCIAGMIKDTNTKLLTNIQKLFFQPIIQIKLKKDYSHFFDIMQAQNFLKAIDNLQVTNFQ